jgi:hypothetical protein
MSEPSSCFPRRRQGFDPMHEAWVRWWVAAKLRQNTHQRRRPTNESQSATCATIASVQSAGPTNESQCATCATTSSVPSAGPNVRPRKNRSHGASPSIRAHLYSEARCRLVARRGRRMSPDILKRKRGRHLSRQACRQAADLRVDVSEVGKRCPTAHPHDRAVRCPTKLHGHGPTGPEAVR